jgi:site-specific recombinase XerD
MGYGPAMTADCRPSLVRSFERHLRAENRSEHTIASYLESLRQAEAFLAGRSLVDARREDLEAFLGELLQRRAEETVATRYRRLRVLYRWLEEEEEIPASPMAWGMSTSPSTEYAGLIARPSPSTPAMVHRLGSRSLKIGLA